MLMVGDSAIGIAPKILMFTLNINLYKNRMCHISYKDLIGDRLHLVSKVKLNIGVLQFAWTLNTKHQICLNKVIILVNTTDLKS